MSRLLVNEKGDERTVELTAAVIHIGRGPDNEVVINDQRSSRKHCRLSRTPQGWVLEDLKSRNGTTLNGIVVDRNFLKDGDDFAIGSVRFHFQERAAAAEGESPDEVEAADLAVEDDEDRLVLPPEGRPPAQAAETVAGPAEFRLEGTEGDHSGQRIPIPRFPFTIGRHEDNDFRIADRRASGHHARIVERGGRHYIEDLGSRNGTILNHRRVREGALAPGFLIRIGDSSFRVEMPPVEGAEPPAAAGEPEEEGAAAEADFTRFDAREFLREGERASPLSVAAILLVLGGLLYWTLIGVPFPSLVDIALDMVRRKDPDPPEEGNKVANWSFEDPAEGTAIPGWALAEGSEGDIALSPEGAQFPGGRALRVRPAGAGLTRTVSLRDIPIESGERYRVAAHVTNLGAFAAGVSVVWLAESGGSRVEVGRDWGAAVRVEALQEDLERIVTPPPAAVLARVMPFVLDPAEGKGGGGAAFDRVLFARTGEHAGEGEVPPEGAPPPEEGEKEPVLPVEVRNGAEEAGIAGTSPQGPPIRLEVAADGALRGLRRGSRVVLASLWVGLASEADPLALGPRLLTRLKQASEREGVFLLSQLPDTRKGEWIPLETRVQGQGGEIQCEFRFGHGRSPDAAPADRAMVYLEPAPTVKEVVAFGGALKSPATFPPERPEAGPIEELQFGAQGEQTVIIFRPPVTLRAIPHPEMPGRTLLSAEASLSGEPEARGRKSSTAVLSLRISPFSRREDEAVAALLKDAESLQRDAKPVEARARLRDLESRYPWRAGDIARAGELIKAWNGDAERALAEIEAGLDDLKASPSPVIRDALLARLRDLTERFKETPSRARMEELATAVRGMVPSSAPGGDGPPEPLLKEARSHYDRGEIGLADLCLRLAREAKLSPAEEEGADHLARLIGERRKQRANEEVR